MNPEFQARLLDPPLQTADLPGIGGRTRMRPEDFAVHEIPAYGPDGRPGAHLLFTLRKRGIGTEDAIVELSRQTGIPRPEIGLAGLKDKDAVTEQWISVPFAAGPRLAQFSHPAITLGQAHPHGNKLRRHKNAQQPPAHAPGYAPPDRGDEQVGRAGAAVGSAVGEGMLHFESA